MTRVELPKGCWSIETDEYNKTFLHLIGTSPDWLVTNKALTETFLAREDDHVIDIVSLDSCETTKTKYLESEIEARDKFPRLYVELRNIATGDIEHMEGDKKCRLLNLVEAYGDWDEWYEWGDGVEIVMKDAWRKEGISIEYAKKLNGVRWIDCVLCTGITINSSNYIQY
jgi:hypothetical protein